MTTLPHGRPLTRSDLDALPDDGHRYELVDGVLVVTPSPRPVHQRVLAGLYRLLHAGCPPELEVFFAPVDVVLADDTVLQPDLLVVRRADLGDRGVTSAPVLAVEVLSPSTRRVDVTLKRSRYESAGCQSYWVVDPDGPAFTAWELHGTAYVEVAAVRGDDVFTTDQPWPVEVVPSTLAR